MFLIRVNQTHPRSGQVLSTYKKAILSVLLQRHLTAHANIRHINRRSYAYQSKKAIVLDCNDQSCHNSHQLNHLSMKYYMTGRGNKFVFHRPLLLTIRYKWLKKTASESMSNLLKTIKPYETINANIMYCF